MKIECIIGKIRHISQQSDKFLKQRIKEENLPILMNHIPLFYILPYNGEKMQFNELGKQWGIAKSSLSDIISKYEDLGLISRVNCNDDKRSIYIGLTEEAQRIKDKLDLFEVEFLDTMLKDFTQEERTVFEEYIKKSIQNL